MPPASLLVALLLLGGGPRAHAARPAEPPGPSAAVAVPGAASAAARDEAVRLLATALAAEPSIAQVQRAAEARAGPPRDEAEGWRRRDRWAALVPRVVAEYRHDERTYREVGLTSAAEVDYVRSTPADTVTVRLDWSLDGLVFGRHELAAVAAAQAAAARRLAAVERATRLYYERLRLRVAVAAAPPGEGQARAELELELQGVTAQLDALTGLYGGALP